MSLSAFHRLPGSPTFVLTPYHNSQPRTLYHYGYQAGRTGDSFLLYKYTTLPTKCQAFYNSFFLHQKIPHRKSSERDSFKRLVSPHYIRIHPSRYPAGFRRLDSVDYSVLEKEMALLQTLRAFQCRMLLSISSCDCDKTLCSYSMYKYTTISAACQAFSLALASPVTFSPTTLRKTIGTFFGSEHTIGS